VVSIEYTTKSGFARSKLVYVTWIPDTISRATFKESARVKSTGLLQSGVLRSAFKGVGSYVEANQPDELEIGNVLERIARRDREEADLTTGR